MIVNQYSISSRFLVVAKDKFHDAVKNALIKENWTITNDPLFLQFGGVDVYIDLGAERLIAAEKDNQKIAVEIKSFLNLSVITDFYAALGQFMSYRLILREEDPERILYLAIPSDIYNTFFQLLFARTAIQDYQLKLIVYDSSNEVIIQWLR